MPARLREVAQWICATFAMPILRSCRLILLRRLVFYYKGRPRDYILLRRRLRELAGTRCATEIVG